MDAILFIYLYFFFVARLVLSQVKEDYIYKKVRDAGTIYIYTNQGIRLSAELIFL